jgi:hypothetical protein
VNVDCRYKGEHVKTKKALKELVRDCPERLELTDQSFHGEGWCGMLNDAPNGTYRVVGPDPYTKRNWFANILVNDHGAMVK